MVFHRVKLELISNLDIYFSSSQVKRTERFLFETLYSYWQTFFVTNVFQRYFWYIAIQYYKEVSD